MMHGVKRMEAGWERMSQTAVKRREGENPVFEKAKKKTTERENQSQRSFSHS